MATNIGIPFSESPGGIPVNASLGTSAPGQLVHIASSTADDYVWLWLSNTSDLSTEVRVYKGNPTNGYTLDSSLILTPKTGKQLVEPGILITSSTELRVYVLLAADATRPTVMASGHVYRRVD